jgi:hypothetical protein
MGQLITHPHTAAFTHGVAGTLPFTAAFTHGVAVTLPHTAALAHGVAVTLPHTVQTAAHTTHADMGHYCKMSEMHSLNTIQT